MQSVSKREGKGGLNEAVSSCDQRSADGLKPQGSAESLHTGVRLSFRRQPQPLQATCDWRPTATGGGSANPGQGQTATRLAQTGVVADYFWGVMQSTKPTPAWLSGCPWPGRLNMTAVIILPFEDVPSLDVSPFVVEEESACWSARCSVLTVARGGGAVMALMESAWGSLARYEAAMPVRVSTPERGLKYESGKLTVRKGS